MTRPTIVVNDIAVSPGGGLTVLEEFYEAVLKYGSRIDWVFLLPKPYLSETTNVKIVLLPKVKQHFNRLSFDHFTGCRLINKFKPSLVLSMQNTLTYGCHGKSVVYLHQPIPFQNIKRFSFFKPEEFKYACIQYLLGHIIKRSVYFADLTIVQTEWMKHAVEKQCKRANVMQIRPDQPIINSSAQYEKTHLFFYPTSTLSYKNNGLFESAIRRIRASGIEARAIMTINGLSDDAIEYVGRIPRYALYEYYTTSCLVFPSYIETFGYPLVEARAAGALILASDCAFSHELLDDYSNAYFFDPFAEDQLIDLMTRVATGRILRKEEPFQDGHGGALVNEPNSWCKMIDVLEELIAK